MSLTSVDIIVALSLLICGLLGIARGAIRQLVSIACCSLGLIFTGLLASPLAKATGASPASFGRFAPLLWLFLAVILLVVAARIVHMTLPARIGIVDRALGLLLGFVRGFGVVAVPLMFFVWVMPADKLPDYMRNALSFPLLKYVMNMVPSLRPTDLHSRLDTVSASFWLAIGSAAIPSTLVDLVAALTRRRRLRRLESKLFGRKSGVGPQPAAGPQRIIIATPTPGDELPPGFKDYRTEAERDIERQAVRGDSKGPEIDGLIEELIQIGRTKKFLGESGPDFNDQRDNIRAREIGESLNDIGGKELMQFACYRVGKILGPEDMRQLEWAWNNIGEWWA